MDKKRTIIIATILLLTALLLLLFRVGSLSKKIEEQDQKIDRVEKNITKAIKNIPSSGKAQGDSESLTAELLYSFHKYNEETNKVRADFSVVPKEISKNLKVSLFSNGKVIKLEKDSVVFQGKHDFRLNDKFLNLVNYDRDGVVSVDTLPQETYNQVVGDMILPKLSMEKKDVEANLTENTYDIKAVIKFMMDGSKNNIVDEKGEEKVDFNKLEMITEKNRIIEDIQTFDISDPGFEEEFNDLQVKFDTNPMDTIHVYIKATDDYGLTHISYIDVQNDKQTYPMAGQVKVYNSAKKEVFEYEY